MLFGENFPIIKLFKAFRSTGISLKKGQVFSKELLASRDVATKGRTWLQATKVVNDAVLYRSWVDDNIVQLITASHSVEDPAEIYFLHPRKRAGLSKDSGQPIGLYYPSTVAQSALLFG